MNLIRVGARSLNGGLSRQCCQPWMTKSFSSSGNSGDANDANKSNNAFETSDDFERRMFTGFSNNNATTDSFYQKLDKINKPWGRSGYGGETSGGNNTQFMDGLDESFSTLSDGMDGKLKEAAAYFEFDPEEIEREDYSFRPDANFPPGEHYDIKDLDLNKPGVRRPTRRPEFETTTKQVLERADFRNVKFLANFITEAGIIEKRSKFKISAKAQRKIAREIKTARAFGLMPFTTMGQDPFVAGKTREDDDDGEEEDYDSYFTR